MGGPAAALGLEGVSSHSGRRGLASEFRPPGRASTTDVQEAGWCSPSMVVKRTFADIVATAAERHGVDPDLVHAVTDTAAEPVHAPSTDGRAQRDPPEPSIGSNRRSRKDRSRLCAQQTTNARFEAQPSELSGTRRPLKRLNRLQCDSCT